jgi:hypothetical protein
MPQIQLDLPEDVVEEVRRQAETRGVSVNYIVAEMVRGGRATGWPADFFDEVVGGWKGEPLVRAEQHLPEVRDKL